MKRKKNLAPVLSLSTGVYRHYKGQHYLVLGVAKHSETEEDFVVYVRLYARTGGPFWIRPLANFTSQVPGPKGRRIKRFTHVGAEQPAER